MKFKYRIPWLNYFKMNQPKKEQISVKLLRYRCIGCSYCISVAPDVFSISTADGKVTSILNKTCDTDIANFSADLLYIDQIEQSARICPVNAIFTSKKD